MQIHTFRRLTSLFVLGGYLLLFAAGVHHYHHMCILKPDAANIVAQQPAVDDPFSEKGSPCYFHSTYNNLHNWLPVSPANQGLVLTAVPLPAERHGSVASACYYSGRLLRGPPRS